MSCPSKGIRIIDTPSLKERTTMGIGGNAIAEVHLEDPTCVEQLPALLERLGGRAHILGGGSNILAQDGDLSLVLITVASEEQPEIVKELNGSVLVRVGAGVRLSTLLARCAAWGLGGLEGLAGIPGSVGGALYMNAGSFGNTTGEAVYTMEVFSPLLGQVQFLRDQLQFSYRRCEISGHRGWFLIRSATFALTKNSPDAIRATMRENFRRKRLTQPLQAQSAGCVFKNPSPEHPAGKLLEEAGMKGVRLGAMAFSSLHANFLVNEGNGEFEQAMDIIEIARDKVQAFSGHTLELEVRIWP